MNSIQIYGIPAPIIRAGDDLASIVMDSVFRQIEPQNGDIIGITESVVARAQNNYVTIDEVATSIRLTNTLNLPILVFHPIFSRNRFAPILRAIARASKDITLVLSDRDQVGNPLRNHPFTGLNYDDYYISICKEEGAMVTIKSEIDYNAVNRYFTIDCCLRPNTLESITPNWVYLSDICNTKSNYGLLGSNRVSDTVLKLFPNQADAQEFVDNVKFQFAFKGYDVETMIFSDGCFKDPLCGIWEFADPTTSPAYTKGLSGTPNELKLKALADDKFSNLSGKELEDAVKEEIRNKPESLIADMSSQGTTPRRVIDLLASLMDLTSGSGDRGTPIVVVRNYFKNYGQI